VNEFVRVVRKPLEGTRYMPQHIHMRDTSADELPLGTIVQCTLCNDFFKVVPQREFLDWTVWGIHRYRPLFWRTLIGWMK
jgi:hypothetical protein